MATLATSEADDEDDSGDDVIGSVTKLINDHKIDIRQGMLGCRSRTAI